MPRPHARKASLATLCALATGALVLAPAGASALTSTGTANPCYLLPGSKTHGFTASGKPCTKIEGGSAPGGGGGPIKGNEVIKTFGTAPKLQEDPFDAGCTGRTCLPGSRGGEIQRSPEGPSGPGNRGGGGGLGSDYRKFKPMVIPTEDECRAAWKKEEARLGQLPKDVQKTIREKEGEYAILFRKFGELGIEMHHLAVEISRLTSAKVDPKNLAGILNRTRKETNEVLLRKADRDRDSALGGLKTLNKELASLKGPSDPLLRWCSVPPMDPK